MAFFVMPRSRSMMAVYGPPAPMRLEQEAPLFASHSALFARIHRHLTPGTRRGQSVYRNDTSPCLQGEAELSVTRQEAVYNLPQLPVCPSDGGRRGEGAGGLVRISAQQQQGPGQRPPLLWRTRVVTGTGRAAPAELDYSARHLLAHSAPCFSFKSRFCSPPKMRFRGQGLLGSPHICFVQGTL
ncbi:hypothetical protein NDU88_001505 [Pleurodeles waltl]|uniref:Uncharacterized protein n=1 Tax=Pleurodeles waltl TaxID=8319 RepID=A0AAV7TKA6_PLEWA|nr:hypothetical protein NDU88_001505 [Pleurodeles waltl]